MPRANTSPVTLQLPSTERVKRQRTAPVNPPEAAPQRSRARRRTGGRPAVTQFGQAVALTDTGLTRSNNEDAVLTCPGLLILSDGMGGHDAGEVASSTAVLAVADRAEEIVDIAARCVASEVVSYLETICQDAAHAVEEEGRRLGKQIGCTLVIAVAGPDGVFVAHVGDSRAYLLRAGRLTQLTTDHSLYEMLRKKGVSHENASRNQHAPKLIQALGFGPVDPDVALVPLGSEDTLLLCTDGLHDFVEQQVVVSALENTNLSEAAQDLVDAANDAGGHDNTSVVIARVRARESSSQIGRRLAWLRSIPLFAEVSEVDLTNVVPYMRTIRFRAGDVLAREGEEGHTAIMLLEGRVEIRKGDVRLTDVGPGGNFGEMALTRPWTRSATVAAVEGGLAFSLSRESFQDLCRARPDIGILIHAALASSISDRLADLTERLTVIQRAAQGHFGRR